jgi:hypothetical protein
LGSKYKRGIIARIVETSQIDLTNTEQLRYTTVQLICGIQNYKGEKNFIA